MDDDSPTSRWAQRTEVPLGIASLLFLTAYAVHVLAHGMPDWGRRVCLIVIAVAWAMFLVDYLVLWRLSGRGLAFVRTHVLDTVVLVLPLLRPLRVVRLYDAVLRRRGEPRLPLYARVMFYASIAVLLLGFAGALAVYQAEYEAPGATIRTFGDSVWWASSTLATVGYGDVTPVTARGRVIAVAMMACGLALLGAVTGSFSSWLLQVFSREGDDERPPRS
ncbi:potassium channel family protein [Streptomyces sp. M41(2017)]|nr:potassium channel family protein [Streptomyces sp. M41(2017)]OQQ15006.1 ion transporter [Streptomyces sp. M41(2017)]